MNPEVPVVWYAIDRVAWKARNLWGAYGKRCLSAEPRSAPDRGSRCSPRPVTAAFGEQTPSQWSGDNRLARQGWEAGALRGRVCPIG